MNSTPQHLWSDPNYQGLGHLFLFSLWHLYQKLQIDDNWGRTGLPSPMFKVKFSFLVKNKSHTWKVIEYCLLIDGVISNWTGFLLEKDAH